MQNPAQPLTTAGGEVDDLDHDLLICGMFRSDTGRISGFVRL